MYLDKFDMMQMFDCRESKAMMIIRCIKKDSDTLHLKGKVTPAYFDYWYNKRQGTIDKKLPKRGANVVG